MNIHFMRREFVLDYIDIDHVRWSAKRTKSEQWIFKCKWDLPIPYRNITYRSRWCEQNEPLFFRKKIRITSNLSLPYVFFHFERIFRASVILTATPKSYDNLINIIHRTRAEEWDELWINWLTNAIIHLRHKWK